MNQDHYERVKRISEASKIVKKEVEAAEAQIARAHNEAICASDYERRVKEVLSNFEAELRRQVPNLHLPDLPLHEGGVGRLIGVSPKCAPIFMPPDLDLARICTPLWAKEFPAGAERLELDGADLAHSVLVCGVYDSPARAADLRGARLDFSRIHLFFLDGADLTGASLRASDLAISATPGCACFRNADLTCAIISVLADRRHPADFSNANLSFAQLRNIVPDNLELAGARLRGCSIDVLTLGRIADPVGSRTDPKCLSHYSQILQGLWSKLTPDQRGQVLLPQCVDEAALASLFGRLTALRAAVEATPDPPDELRRGFVSTARTLAEGMPAAASQPEAGGIVRIVAEWTVVHADPRFLGESHPELLESLREMYALASTIQRSRLVWRLSHPGSAPIGSPAAGSKTAAEEADGGRVERAAPTVDSGGRSKCFIATAAWGSEHHRDVVRLRDFRDLVLRRSVLGSCLIRVYGVLSPPIAWLIRHSPVARALVRWLIVRPAAALSERLLRKR